MSFYYNLQIKKAHFEYSPWAQYMVVTAWNIIFQFIFTLYYNFRFLSFYHVLSKCFYFLTYSSHFLGGKCFDLFIIFFYKIQFFIFYQHFCNRISIFLFFYKFFTFLWKWTFSTSPFFHNFYKLNIFFFTFRLIFQHCITFFIILQILYIFTKTKFLLKYYL